MFYCCFWASHLIYRISVKELLFWKWNASFYRTGRDCKSSPWRSFCPPIYRWRNQDPQGSKVSSNSPKALVASSGLLTTKLEPFPLYHTAFLFFSIKKWNVFIKFVSVLELCFQSERSMWWLLPRCAWKGNRDAKLFLHNLHNRSKGSFCGATYISDFDEGTKRPGDKPIVVKREPLLFTERVGRAFPASHQYCLQAEEAPGPQQVLKKWWAKTRG